MKTQRTVNFHGAIASHPKTAQNSEMPHESTHSYLADSTRLFHYYKDLAERAVVQAPDEALTTALDAESNSIAIIVKHLSGNMRSRWTDFLASDGEKNGRNRDAEFESPATTRDQLLAQWEAGWQCLFDALAALSDADLNREVLLRSEPHTVMQAINRQLGHYSYHVGQIVFLAKHFSSDRWTALTIPRGKSAEFTAKIRAAQAARNPGK
jgi:hypothetical protein